MTRRMVADLRTELARLVWTARRGGELTDIILDLRQRVGSFPDHLQQFASHLVHTVCNQATKIVGDRFYKQVGLGPLYKLRPIPTKDFKFIAAAPACSGRLNQSAEVTQ